jgi:hypothetical protein
MAEYLSLVPGHRPLNNNDLLRPVVRGQPDVETPYHGVHYSDIYASARMCVKVKVKRSDV